MRREPIAGAVLILCALAMFVAGRWMAKEQPVEQGSLAETRPVERQREKEETVVQGAPAPVAPVRQPQEQAHTAGGASLEEELRSLRACLAERTPDARTVCAVEVLSQDVDGKVRALGVQAGGAMYGPENAVSALNRRISMPLPLVRLLVKMARADPSPEVRRSAVHALGFAPADMVTDALLAALNDPSRVVREAAHGYFRRIYRKSIPPDPQAWRRELDAQKVARSKMLARVEAEMPGTRLLGDIEKHFVPVQDKRVVEPLLRTVAYHGTSPHIASRAMRIVSGLVDNGSAPEVLAILRDEKLGTAIRSEAAAALGKIGTEEHLPALLETVNDKALSPWIRANAAHALVRFRAELTVPCLLQALLDDAPQVRRFAEEALCALDATEAREPLINSLQHKNAAARAGSARIIGQRRLRGARDALLLALKDPDLGVRRAAARAVAAWRDEEVLAPVLALYEDAPPKLQAEILSAVVWSKSPEIATLAVKAAAHHDEQIRRAAVHWIGQAAPPGALGILTEALKDESAAVKRTAIEGMSSLEDPDAIQSLVSLASSAEEPAELRSWTLAKLSKHASKIKTDSLLRLTTDPNAQVRFSAAQLLGRGRHRPAVGRLIELLRDRGDAVRVAARLSLRLITGQHFKETEFDKWETWWREAQKSGAGE